MDWLGDFQQSLGEPVSAFLRAWWPLLLIGCGVAGWFVSAGSRRGGGSSGGDGDLDGGADGDGGGGD